MTYCAVWVIGNVSANINITAITWDETFTMDPCLPAEIILLATIWVTFITCFTLALNNLTVNKCRKNYVSQPHTYRSISSGGTSRKGLQMARAALLTKPSNAGRDSNADLVAFQSVRSRFTVCSAGHSSCQQYAICINFKLNIKSR